MNGVGDPAERQRSELTAESKRLREALVDSTTGLASLPAVLEDLRHRVEHGERLGLVYLDLSSEAQLETIYGWETYDSLLHQVAEVLGTFWRDELRQADVAVVAGLHGDEFIIFVGLGRGDAGQAQLKEIQAGILQRLSARLQVQFNDEMPRPVMLNCASAILRHDPMVRIERTLYRCLDDLRAECRQRREEQYGKQLAELRRIVSAADVEVRFQPIVRLKDGEVHGFEALTCGPPGSIFESPEMLFSFAEGTDHITELERICRLKSVHQARALDAGTKLFLNCSARVLSDPESFCRGLLGQAEACGLRPADIVLELTERVAITAWQEFRRSVAALRLIGFPIAIVDVGAGYSSLKSVAEVEPDYLKVDLSLIREVHRSRLKRSLLDSLMSIATTIDAQVIAEGVEDEEEFHALRELNIDLGQGYYFGRPDPSGVRRVAVPRF
ncbi:MAG: EAL domain-containing protein [Acidobacteria bacterium]|nr:EAL domain-containing protein [Acidobacteriota bacterium]